MNHRGKGRFSSLKMLYTYVRPHILFYILSILNGIYKFLVPVVYVWLLGKSIDLITGYSEGSITQDGAWLGIRRYIIISLAFLCVSPGPTYLRSYFSAKATSRTILKLRCDLYRHIQNLSHSFFDINKSGSLVSRLIGDVESISRFLSTALITFWINMGTFIVILTYLLSMNVTLTLVALCLIPLQFFVFLRLGTSMKRISKTIRQKVAELSGNTQEKLGGITVVKSFTKEEEEIHLFRTSSGQLADENVRAGSIHGIGQATMQFLSNLGPLLVLTAGSVLALFHPQMLSVSVLVQFMMLQRRLNEPFANLSEMILQTAEAVGCMDRIHELLLLKPDVEEPAHGIIPGKLAGKIEFRDVFFSYHDEEEKLRVISDFNLAIPEKRITAIVGESGSGKSTIVKLVNRFYDVNKGTILIDGKDIKEYNLQALRKEIALVPQDPVLFSGSIRENLLYGNPEASEKQVIEAVKNAFAYDFIMRMPDGLDTVVGERGILLSGGQRQRISIARAFLKNPSVIIFDEATSSLDTESELMIQKALDRLLEGKTAIIIAHCFSTIRNSHLIAVIDEGEVIETGAHEELYARKDRYYELCKLQFNSPDPSESLLPG